MNVPTTLRLQSPLGDRVTFAVARPDPTNASAPAARDGWLRGEELERFARFKVDHARADFLAGRRAAKSALCALHPDTAPADWELVRGEWRQPLPRGPVSGVAVTLAHSGGTAVAVASEERYAFGIDLETVDREAAAVVRTQVTDAETAWAEAGGADAQVRWMLLWTAREALGKRLRTGLLFPERIPATAIWSEHHGIWTARLAGTAAVEMRAVVAGGFAACLAAPPADDGGSWLEPGMRWLATVLADALP